MFDPGGRDRRDGTEGPGSNAPVAIFSTCPMIANVARSAYLRTVVDAARWSEKWGCTGTLVYTDNSQIDPWLVSQIIIENTSELAPLVAVQPIYMHPYTVAKMVSSFGYLYGRRTYLNMVAGGFQNDLAALDDRTPHDKRYERLMEYAKIIKNLLANQDPVNFQGEFYRATNLRMRPGLSPDLFPEIFLSGTSEAGLCAARELGALPILYAKPASEYTSSPVGNDSHFGIRVGLIARPTEEEAWQVAHKRFPEDQKGRITHQLAMKVSDSSWHHQLSALAGATKDIPSTYWLVPFENYKTFCPYLVGSYERVAEEIARYVKFGCRTFILDIPVCEEDLRHARMAFDLACLDRQSAPAERALGRSARDLQNEHGGSIGPSAQTECSASIPRTAEV